MNRLQREIVPDHRPHALEEEVVGIKDKEFVELNVELEQGTKCNGIPNNNKTKHLMAVKQYKDTLSNHMIQNGM
eukprot:9801541-Ditylum_brightwellii.AAC.1